MLIELPLLVEPLPRNLKLRLKSVAATPNASGPTCRRALATQSCAGYPFRGVARVELLRMTSVGGLGVRSTSRPSIAPISTSILVGPAGAPVALQA